MWGYIIGGALAWLVGDAVSKHYTDKHLHEHVFDWYCELRDAVTDWLHQNSEKEIKYVGLKVVEWMDSGAVTAKRLADKVVTLVAFAQTPGGRVYRIAEEKIQAEQVVEMIPELTRQPILLTELTH
ncbi:MAG: hypothetical protein ABMA26_21205 [Limisphaerales bacterium]